MNQLRGEPIQSRIKYWILSFMYDYKLNIDLYMASSQYSVVKHTIFPLIFKIAHKNTLSYLIRDPATSSLIFLPSLTEQQPSLMRMHVGNIQKQFQCRLTHTFTNSNRQISQVFDEKIIYPSAQGQLRPELIGQLSICYIGAPGYILDYNLIAATHISPTSTKFPVLFVGKALSVCSIDVQSQTSSQDYMQTLNKLKYFPNQTYLFPQKKVAIEDLQFAFALQKSNSFLSQKIEQFVGKNKQIEDCLIPTSILEEKAMNPFFNPQKYSSILKSSEKATCFQMLRKMRKQWRK